MKKFYLLAATALMSLAATAQTSVGIQRAHDAEGKTYTFTSTDDFAKGADGLTVSFWQSAEIEKVLDATTQQTGMIYRRVQSQKADYCWKIDCSSTGWGGATDHAADAKFPEGYAFGFDMTVPEGQQFNVSGLTFDLVIKANPTWRARILDADGKELYNSGAMEQYQNMRAFNACGSYAVITSDTLQLHQPGEDEQSDYDFSIIDEKTQAAMNAGFQLLPKDFVLAAGSYRVVLDVDYANSNPQPITFDCFFIEGELTSTAAGEPRVGIKRSYNEADKTYSFTSTADFAQTVPGVGVTFWQSAEIEKVLDATTQQTGMIYRRVQGQKADYCWKIDCSSTGWGGATDHAADAKFPEGYAFGFDMTVPEGQQFNVSGLTFDLVIKANPTWRARILDADGKELYNSGAMEQYQNMRAFNACGSYAVITSDTLQLHQPGEDEQSDYDFSIIDEKTQAAMNAGFQLLPKDFVLAAGSYRVVLDVDYANSNPQPITFDCFFIDGELVEAMPVNTDVYSIIGTINGNWDTDWDLEETATAGVYTYSVENFEVATTTTYEYKVRSNHNWDEGTYELPASGEGNFSKELQPGIYTLTFTFNLNENTLDLQAEKTGEYVPVEKTYTVYFVNTKDWDDVRVWAWNGGENYTGGTWPGVPATKTDEQQDGHDVYTWSVTTTVMPAYIIFNGNNGSAQTNDLAFVDGATYDADGNITTGISELSTLGTQHSALVYNLRGQRVAAPVKGQLYIVNGKKFIER